VEDQVLMGIINPNNETHEKFNFCIRDRKEFFSKAASLLERSEKACQERATQTYKHNSRLFNSLLKKKVNIVAEVETSVQTTEQQVQIKEAPTSVLTLPISKMEIVNGILRIYYQASMSNAI